MRMKHMLSVVDSRHGATLDNGREFGQHEQVSVALGSRIYFARLYPLCVKIVVRSIGTLQGARS